MSDDEEVDETEEEEEEEKPAKPAPSPKKGMKFNPDDMGKVMGKVGVADIYDLFVFAAGILGIIIFIIKFTALSQSKDYWLIVYYALSIWVYLDTALATKLGPWLASKFKSTSSAFSFLRDETDAKNFVVIIGAWTTVLGILTSAVYYVGTNINNWEVWVYLPMLVLFGIFLIKGRLQKK